MKNKKLWDIVNNCDDLDSVYSAEKIIRNSDLSCDDFDDLMMALSYISRELYEKRRK